MRDAAVRVSPARGLKAAGSVVGSFLLLSPFQDLVRKAMRKLSAVACLALLFGCGGGSGPTPQPTPAPTPPPPRVLLERSHALPFSDEFISSSLDVFTAPSSGLLEIIVDWTHLGSTIDVLVMRGICTFEQLNANQCDVISFTRESQPKPRQIELPGEPAGDYTMVIGNLGPNDESISFQVIHHANAPTATSAREPATSPLRPADLEYRTHPSLIPHER